MYTHVLLEVYCELDFKDNVHEGNKKGCKSLNGIPSYQCLLNRCPYVAFTSCENSLCYIGKTSIAEELISFGGDMGSDDEIEKWKLICLEKINEAYDDYANKK